MLRTPVALRTQVRAAHTRAKKVNVQLIKEPYGRRLRGEVFPVAEGHMRLKLHPEGKAVYVRPNEPTPIPILPTAKAQEIRREIQAQAKANAAAAEAERAKEEEVRVSASEAAASASRSKVQSLLDSLDFPSAANQSASASTTTTKAVDEVNNETKSSESAEISESAKPSEDSSSSGKQFDWQSDLVVKITNKK